MTDYRWWYLLLFCGCSSAAVPATSKPTSGPAESAADFTLTQNSSSQPARGLHASKEPPPFAVDQSCAAESCEGELSSSAVSELKKTAAAATDCYERELKDNAELEGKVTLLLRVLDRGAQAEGPCHVKVDSATFKLPAPFEACLIAVLKQTAARSTQGCVDVALPLSFVRQEVEVATAGAGGVGGGAGPAAGGKSSR